MLATTSICWLTIFPFLCPGISGLIPISNKLPDDIIYDSLEPDLPTPNIFNCLQQI